MIKMKPNKVKKDKIIEDRIPEVDGENENDRTLNNQEPNYKLEKQQADDKNRRNSDDIINLEFSRRESQQP